MENEINTDSFDWKRMFLSYEFPVDFMIEIAFRTAIMFLFLLIVLKFLSKRGVKQLSIFELAILIALGSATGDPMFYPEIPILHGFTVLAVVIILYKVITFFTAKSKNVEAILEGKPVLLLLDGQIEYDNYRRIGLPYDKFFGELRMKSIDHLGQLKRVYLETSGELSIYPFTNDEVKPGLPIYPELINDPITKVEKEGKYACITCGNIQELPPAKENSCNVCNHSRWLPVWSNTRVN